MAEDAVESDCIADADPSLDEVTAFVPTSPSYREGISLWVWDDAGRFCLPRIGIEAVGATWTSTFETAICLAFPDGRLFLANADELPHPVIDESGRPRSIGAGPVSFRCVEPFQRWRAAFDGRVAVSDVASYLAGGVPKLRIGTGREEIQLRVDIDARMVAPPWFQGSHDPRGHHVPGERRFEQLSVVTGTVVLGDQPPLEFTGGALRVHRKGGDRNDYGDFHGHTWQSARFPSGRAFGYIHYRPGPDGEPRYLEGWMDEGAGIMPARVEDTPWLHGVRPSGEEVSFTLRTASGATRIQGTTFASSFRPPRPTGTGATFPTLQSSIARYRWGDEEAYGMLERSAPL